MVTQKQYNISVQCSKVSVTSILCSYTLERIDHDHPHQRLLTIQALCVPFSLGQRGSFYRLYFSYSSLGM